MTAVKVSGMRSPRWRTAALVACGVGVLSVARAEERVIHYTQDALTVRLAKAPMTEVLDEVARQAGADVRGSLKNPGEVSAEFDEVALPEALHRLLGDQNFMLVYGTGGQLKAIRLLGGPAGPTTGATHVATTPTTLAPNAPVELTALIARHAPLPISGRLQEAVGAPTASIPQLIEMGVHHEDAAVRGEALRTLVSTLEIEPALRAAFVGQLNALDDVTLSSMLRGAAGERAEEVAMQILTQARASEIRVKASSVLQKLRAGS
ncbi:MAG TPA: hypothetical protein VKA21_16340 [Candidatus Binatia bacterium]|nr:hypothetical protein [Candidatus Binatia bacterium]